MDEWMDGWIDINLKNEIETDRWINRYRLMNGEIDT